MNEHIQAVETQGFREARRELAGITAAAEKRLLLWLAARLPKWVMPDHLTGLGLLAMLGAGALYAMSLGRPWLLLLVNLALVVNWFGDSLDGTLARYRRRLRPRYGFYLDHLVDAFGALFLLGGLAVSGYMSPVFAAAVLVAYELLSIEIYLAAYTLGRFKISAGPVGGTELRLLLCLANVALFAHPEVRLLGHALRLFDALGAVMTAGITLTLLASSIRNARELRCLERGSCGAGASVGACESGNARPPSEGATSLLPS
jgi:phosphatidylglycerophosphate synthase